MREEECDLEQEYEEKIVMIWERNEGECYDMGEE